MVGSLIHKIGRTLDTIQRKTENNKKQSMLTRYERPVFLLHVGEGHLHTADTYHSETQRP